MPEPALTTNLRDAIERFEPIRAWVPTIGATLATVTDRWSLDVGEPFEPGGHTAWVAPARTAAGQAVALKIGLLHPEGTHEAEALRIWDGNGAVRLLDSFTSGDTVVLLLERCVPGTLLRSIPEHEQDVVIADALRGLWAAPAPASFRTLTVMCDEWADSSEAKHRRAPMSLDRGIVDAGLALLRELPRTADREALLCTDLHAGNVLRAEREPWLVIDPKPHVGDPAYDPIQHMLNCRGRLRADPDAMCRRMAGLAGLDPDRVRLWLFARCVQEIHTWPELGAVAEQIAPR